MMFWRPSIPAPIRSTEATAQISCSEVTGNDTLSGGAGNDVLAGGAGADTVAWGTETLSSANADLVVGYDYTEGDKIDLQSLVSTIVNGAPLTMSISSAAETICSSRSILTVPADGANFTTAYTFSAQIPTARISCALTLAARITSFG